MTQYASPAFWKAYRSLPIGERKAVDKTFALLKADPEHPSLLLRKTGSYWSIRATRRHRALAIDIEQGLLWLWLGSHEEYLRLIDE